MVEIVAFVLGVGLICTVGFGFEALIRVIERTNELIERSHEVHRMERR